MAHRLFSIFGHQEGVIPKPLIAKEKTKFLVRWKGYGLEDDTWEPRASLPQYLSDQFEHA